MSDDDISWIILEVLLMSSLWLHCSEKLVGKKGMPEITPIVCHHDPVYSADDPNTKEQSALWLWSSHSTLGESDSSWMGLVESDHHLAITSTPTRGQSVSLLQLSPYLASVVVFPLSVEMDTLALGLMPKVGLDKFHWFNEERLDTFEIWDLELTFLLLFFVFVLF